MIELSNILKSAKEIFPEIVEIRRHLHQNPELSFQEYKTSEFIQKKLSEYKIPFHIIAKTGIVANIGRGDNCVALRADIDALPIKEETGLEFKSKNDGVMHACGHDMHTSMLLGAGKILKSFESELKGTVKLIFQPGEEKLPGGAKILIDEGVLNDPSPRAIFGQHVNPGEQSGKISVSSDEIMASADELYFTIKGKSGHAAQPHLSNDTILTASQIVLYFQTLMNKFRNPLNPAVLSITAINGGSATNIFPDEVKLMGTLRTFDSDLRNELHKQIEKGAKGIAELYNTICEVRIEIGYPHLVNNPLTTKLAIDTATQLFGKENVLDFEPKMWAEDFSYYAQKIPATFYFLGVRPKNLKVMPALHNSCFSPDEGAMINGISMLAGCAVNFLKS